MAQQLRSSSDGGGGPLQLSPRLEPAPVAAQPPYTPAMGGHGHGYSHGCEESAVLAGGSVLPRSPAAVEQEQREQAVALQVRALSQPSVGNRRWPDMFRSRAVGADADQREDGQGEVCRCRLNPGAVRSPFFSSLAPSCRSPWTLLCFAEGCSMRGRSWARAHRRRPPHRPARRRSRRRRHHRQPPPRPGRRAATTAATRRSGCRRASSRRGRRRRCRLATAASSRCSARRLPLVRRRCRNSRRRSRRRGRRRSSLRLPARPPAACLPISTGRSRELWRMKGHVTNCF